MTLPVMEQYARQKGLDLLTTGDFLHTLWFKEIREELEENGEGIYKLKTQNSKFKNETKDLKTGKDVLFLLSAEISSIYKQGDKLRRIHNLIFVPDFEVAEKVIKELKRRGCNLSSDGRPIVGISSKNLLELVMGIDARAFIIPCHVWTPHFGIYGNASGFDSLEEAFGDYAKYVYGIETGLSSDPDMNWGVRELKGRSILSFSDAHSPAKMGREATVFIRRPADKNRISNFQFPISKSKERFDISYDDIRRAIMRDEERRLEIGYTVEFYPEEGKYHFSGHRNCKYVASPKDIEERGNICPVCKRRLTEGVDLRVRQLADKKLMGRVERRQDAQGVGWFGDRMGLQPPYVKLVPLLEIAAESLLSTVASQKSQNLYAKLCGELGNEIDVLLRSKIQDIDRVGGEMVAEGVKRVRGGDIVIRPGYDGEFGVVRIWEVPEGTSLRDKKDGASFRDRRKAMQRVSKGQLGFDI